MTRERLVRGRAPGLAREDLRHGARDARPTPGRALVLARLISIFGAFPCALLDLAFLRRLEAHAGAPRLGEADGNGLLGRAGAVLAAADLVDLLAHEFACLRRRRLALALVLPGPFDRSLLRHRHSPLLQIGRNDAGGGAAAVLLRGTTRLLPDRSTGARAPRREIRATVHRCCGGRRRCS